MAKVILQRVLDHTGDTCHEVDTTDAEAVNKAMQRFAELVGQKGMLAYAPGDNGEPGKVLKDFDETVEETIFRPRLIGG